MNKTLEMKQFILWEQDIFGYGYGTGEEYIMNALKSFIGMCPIEGNYNYQVLEKSLTPVVTWLFINILCRDNILEYGTSSRFGWLTQRGKKLKSFLEKYSTEELVMILSITEDEQFDLGEEKL